MRRSSVSRALVLVVALATVSPSIAPPARAAAQPPEPSPVPAVQARANSVDAVIERPAAPIQVGTSAAGTVPTGGVAARSAEGQQIPPARPTELVGQRSANGRVIANPDGTFTTETSPERLNYRDPLGGWQPIDVHLVPDTTAGFTHRTKANDMTVRLSTSSAATKGVEIAREDHRVQLRAAGYGTGQVDGSNNKVTYPGSGTHGDLAFLPTTDGLEFTIELSGATDQNEYSLTLDPGDLAPTLALDGSIALRDADGKVGGTISAPVVLDARGIRAPRSAVHTTTMASRGGAGAPAPGVELHYRIDRGWLSASGRAYPVTLDPTVCINGQGITDCVNPPPPPEPTGEECPITDAFDRSLPLDTDGPGWGVSSSGIPWTGSSEYGVDEFEGHTVVNGAGVSDSVTSGYGQMLTLDVQPSMDALFTFESDEDGTRTSYFYLILDSDQSNWVSIDTRYPGYHHTIEALRRGDTDVRRSPEDAFGSGKHWIRVHIDQDKLQVRIWPFAGTEPATWTVESTVVEPDSSTTYPPTGATRTFDLDQSWSADTTRIGSLDITGVDGCAMGKFDNFADRQLDGDLGVSTAGLPWTYRAASGTYRVNPYEHLTVDAGSEIDYAISASGTLPSAPLSMAALPWAPTAQYGNPWGATDDVVAYVTAAGFGVWVAEKYDGYQTGPVEPDWAQGLIDGSVYDGDYQWYPAVTGWDTVVTAFEGPMGNGQVVRPPTPNGHLYAWYPGYADDTGIYLDTIEWPTDGDYEGTENGYWWDLGTESGTEPPVVPWLSQMDLLASFNRTGEPPSSELGSILSFYVSDDEYLDIFSDHARLGTEAGATELEVAGFPPESTHMDLDTEYLVRWQFHPNNYSRARVWKASEPEPTTWLVSGIPVASNLSGFFGIQVGSSDHTTTVNWIDFIPPTSEYAYREAFIGSALPTTQLVGPTLLAGTDPTMGITRSQLYFPDDALPDGAIVTGANLDLYQDAAYSGRGLTVAPIDGSWPTTAVTWNNQPSTNESVRTESVSSCGSAGCRVRQDVSGIVRQWLTRDSRNWKPNLGLQLRLANEDSSCSTESCQVMGVYGSNAPDPSLVPLLRITYEVAKVKLGFDAALGPDFVPSTMPVGRTTLLPVTVKNTGSAYDFTRCAVSPDDCFKVGYRWFDSDGKPAAGSTPGTVNLPSDVESGSTVAVNLSVDPPATPGQYTLRLDLVRSIDGTLLWASDWADPSKYNARVKDPLARPSNVRWLGSSVVARADFPVAVVAGGGTGIGETKSVDLPDGSSIGINLWSQNLHVEGSGGISFIDLGGPVGLGYSYDSANRTDCTSSVLMACGWTTSFDEGFLPGANESDLIYRDGAGNRYFVSTTGSGQLVSSAPVRLDRPRITLFDEGRLTGWSGTDPSVGGGAFSGDQAYSIPGDRTDTTTTSGVRPFALTTYQRVSFATRRTGGATKGAIGFRVKNDTKNTTDWLCYTFGSSYTPATCDEVVPLGGGANAWVQTVGRNMLQDARDEGIAGTYDDLRVTGLDFFGVSGGDGTLGFDAIRFEGRASTIFDDYTESSQEPPFTHSGNVSASTTDKISAANAIKVVNANYANSPACDDCANLALYNFPFVTWSWKKVGGSTIGVTFDLKDVRTDATGSITYYAGPTAPAGAPHPIRIANEAPDDWTAVTRNLLEDGRQLLGFYNDHDTTGTSVVPSGGPTPDDARITGYRLLVPDGGYGLFDRMRVQTVPAIGDQAGVTAGDDYVATFRGGAEHRFDREGHLTRMVDLDGNATTLVWTHDPDGTDPRLTTVRAPSDGASLTSGTAQREIAVSHPTSSSIRFTEDLGSTTSATGRYTEFVRNGSDDLVTVIPARLSAACAGSGESGCLKFAYDGSHRLTRVTDPRDTGSNTLATTVSYSSGDPVAVTASATGSALLRVVDYDDGASWRIRAAYQDSDGIATGAHGFVRYDDLNPNGSVLVEYRPVACPAAGCDAAAAPADKLVEYESDGIDHYTTETRFRTGGNGDPMTTRRGTFAAAKVDNFVDPLTAGLTEWAQSPTQYTASVAAGDPDTYRTNYAYTSLGLAARESTPFTNSAGGTAIRTTITRYDAEGHPVEASDNAFLDDGGFEGGIADWTTTGAAYWEENEVHSGIGSLNLAWGALATQTAQLLPGQTFRLQLATWAFNGAARFGVEYRGTDDEYHQIANASWEVGGAAWTTSSYDVEIPLASTGSVRVKLWTQAGDAALFDDVALFTAFAGSSYLADGRLDTSVDAVGHVTKSGYAAASVHPAIFMTTSTDNYASAGPTNADTNVTSSTTYDAWGRGLTSTDPDGVTATTVYAANKTDVASEAVGDNNPTTYSDYDAIGQRGTALDPIERPTTTTYTFFGDPKDIESPDHTVTHNVYDGVGRLTATYQNYQNSGSGTSGVENVRETRAYDELGHVTRTVADAGGSAATSDAITDTAYDLAGNVTATTTYPDGTSNGRTTRSYFDDAGNAVGTRGAIAPTGAPAPLCPNASPTVYCSSVSTLDLAGKAIATIDAYGKVNRTLYDFAGHAVKEIRNANGAGTQLDPVVTSTSRYDTLGRIVSATDALGRTTSTTYDQLDRIVKVTNDDLSWVQTTYKASGRTDLVSRAGSAGQDDDEVAWTRTLYDSAGRKTTTLENAERTGTAQLVISGFEAGAEGWTSAADGAFVNGGGSRTVSSTEPFTGTARLAVSTTAEHTGVGRDLSGAFVDDHTYRLHARVYVPSGRSVEAVLGEAIAASSNSTTHTVSTTGWQTLDLSWTPTTSVSSQARVAFRTPDNAAFTFYLDDVAIWDAATPDRNIPTTTVYDDAGQILRTVLPPGRPDEAAPLTVSTYDLMGRLESVTLNAITGAGFGASDVNLTTTYDNDKLGRRTDTTDPTNSVSHQDYDRRGNVVVSTVNYLPTEPSSATQNVRSTFAYDDLGELLATCSPQRVLDGCVATTADARAWRYAYDDAGHATTETPPDNSAGTDIVATTAVYDLASGGARMIRSCDHPAGGSCANALRYTTTTYDELGRPRTITTFAGSYPSGVEKLRTISSQDVAGQRTGVDRYEDGVQVDSLTFGHDQRGRETTVARNGTTITTTAFNADATIATRTDHAISATPSVFTYDLRGFLASATSPTYSGATGFSWRLDGLIAGRTWPGETNAATFEYDRAKRPIELREQHGGADQAVLTKAYGRAGDVTAETQVIPGITGNAGQNTQSFTYDPLHRVTSSAVTGVAKSYTYDADSNRVTATENGLTTAFAFNETDELVTQSQAGITRGFTYDAFGNMTQSPVGSAGAADVIAPTTPTGLGATAVAYNRVDLAWTASTDAVGVTSYTVSRNGTYLTTLSGTTTGMTDWSALPSTAYTYAVTARDASGNTSTPSTAANATTPPFTSIDTTAPTVPAGLGATAVSAGQINLAWTASTDAVGVQGYKIYRNGSYLAALGPVGSTAVSDTGLSPATAYSYTVSAIDAAGNESAQSGTANATTAALPGDTTAPSTPTGVGATASAYNSVTVSWTAATDNVGVTRYAISRGGTPLSVVAGSVTSFTDRSTAASTAYAYTVRALDAAGNASAASAPANVTTPAGGGPVSTTFTPTADAYVDSSQPTKNFGTTTTMKVASSGDKKGYLLFNVTGLPAGTISGATLRVYATVADPAGFNAHSSTTTSWTETGIKYSNAPTYGASLGASGAVTANAWASVAVNSAVTSTGLKTLVIANNATSNGTYQSREAANDPQLIVTVTPPPDTTAPTVPTGLGATAVLAGQINLAWTASTDAVGVQGYKIYRNGSYLSAVGPVGSTALNDTGLTPSTAYTYTVSAIDAAGNESAQSSVASATTPAAGAGDTIAPSTPSDVVATASAWNSVTVSWTASTDNVGVTRYTIFRGSSPLSSVAGSVTSFIDRSTSGTTAYAYSVKALDAAGNASAASSAGNVTTPAGGGPLSTTFTPTADAYVDSAQPTKNFGTTTTMKVASNGDKKGYLLFNVTGLPAGTISGATLRVYATAADAAGFKAHSSATTSWTETTIKYPTAPAYGTSLGTSGAVTANAWASVAVNSAVTSTGLKTLVIANNVTSNGTYQSREAANDPQLIVTVSPSIDTTAPTVPAGLGATAVSAGQINLAWTASTDAVGVQGYKIYRNGSYLAALGPVGSTAVSDTGLSPATAYSYTVSAIDAAGNESAQSGTANATTAALPGDTTAPSTPTGVGATASAYNSVTVSWTAATDNVGVTRYAISRGGTPLSVVAGSVTSFTDRSTAASTAYAYTVTALDAAGNASAASAPANVTTPAGGSGPDTTAPSVPTGLATTVISDKQVNLAWTASTDDVGVQSYTVRRNGISVGVVSSTSFSDTTATVGSTYAYTVSANDAAANTSANSAPVPGSTLSWPITNTTYTYDLGDRMTGIASATSPPTTFGIDALGRHSTRSIGGVLSDTYTYAGSSEAIVRIAGPTVTIDSALDALNNRVATRTSTGGFGWLLPDLHGDVAAALNSTGATVTDAFRYDAYGETIDSTQSSLPSPWRYQGRLLLNGEDDSDLYDFVFRSYDPSLGAFLSLDDVKGSAQNPITFNRFLYAAANPETMIDPDGHCVSFNQDGGFDLFGTLGNCGGAPLGFVVGSGESLVGLGAGAVGTVWSAPGHAADIGRCVADTACVNQTTQGILMSGAQLAGEIHDRGQSVLANPEAAVRKTTSTVAYAGADWIGKEHDLLTNHGGFNGGREGAHLLIGIEATGLSFVAGPEAFAALGAKGATAAQALQGTRFAGVAEDVVAAGRRLDDLMGQAGSCALNSFSADTTVATPSGPQAIRSIAVGDMVTAWDPATGTRGTYAVTATFANQDPVTGKVSIDGEVIETTPHHRFLTTEAGWVAAIDLVVGEHVQSLGGGYGTVGSIRWDSGPAPMYDLTVETVHTFAVGPGGWVVHNCNGNSLLSTLAQHMYEIERTSALGVRSIWKYGVSGGPISKAGQSYRATSQVNKLNAEAAAAGTGFTYSARIVTSSATRSGILGDEFRAVYGHLLKYGYKPPGNKRP